MKKIFPFILFFSVNLWGAASMGLDGTGDYVTTNFGNSLKGNQFFSIGMWFYAFSGAGTKLLYGELTSAGTARINIFANATSVNLGVGGRSLDAGGFTTWITGGTDTAYTINTWTHVVFVYNSSTGIQKLYINGNLAHSQSVAVVPIQNVNGTRVPEIAATGNAGQTWLGRESFVFFSSAALTDAEVKEIYNCANHPIKNLVAMWPLWDISTQMDLSGNNNSGALVGDSVVVQDGPPITYCLQ